jgi:hypothetical protein
MTRAAALFLTLPRALTGWSAMTGRPFVRWSDDKGTVGPPAR